MATEMAILETAMEAMETVGTITMGMGTA